MINEFSASPKPQNKSAHIVCAVMMALFALLAVFYALIDRYRGLVGLLAMVFLTAGIYIYTKYISVKYYYDITKDQAGRGLFVVRREVGKRQSTMYMTSLSRIKDVQMRTKQSEEKAKSPYLRYVFKPTLAPDITCHIIVESRLEKSEVVIECTEDFANLLLSYAKEEQELAMREEEDY